MHTCGTLRGPVAILRAGDAAGGSKQGATWEKNPEGPPIMSKAGREPRAAHVAQHSA